MAKYDEKLRAVMAWINHADSVSADEHIRLSDEVKTSFGIQLQKKK